MCVSYDKSNSDSNIILKLRHSNRVSESSLNVDNSSIDKGPKVYRLMKLVMLIITAICQAFVNAV